jgi:F0F1-type ATP synthase membrane subunit b/b'
LAEIENATAGAIQELAERSADMAVGLAGKIVRSELKAADHATLVQRAVADFARKKPVA